MNTNFIHRFISKSPHAIYTLGTFQELKKVLEPERLFNKHNLAAALDYKVNALFQPGQPQVVVPTRDIISFATHFGKQYATAAAKLPAKTVTLLKRTKDLNKMASILGKMPAITSISIYKEPLNKLKLTNPEQYSKLLANSKLLRDFLRNNAR